MHMKTGSGYPGGNQFLVINDFTKLYSYDSVSLKNIQIDGADPDTKQWLEDHKHPVFGFPTLVRFSWGTCTPFFKDAVEVTWSVEIFNLYYASVLSILELVSSVVFCELQSIVSDS
jgi:ribonuclease H2 subunit A